MHKDVSSIPSTHVFKKPGRVVHTYNLSAGEPKMGGSLELPGQPAQAAQRIPIQWETPSQKKGVWCLRNDTQGCLMTSTFKHMRGGERRGGGHASQVW